MVARPTFRIQPFEDPIPNHGARSQPHPSGPTHSRAAPATRSLPGASTPAPGIPSPSTSISSLNPASIAQPGKLTTNIANAASPAAGPAGSGPLTTTTSNNIPSNGNGIKATGAGVGLSSPVKGPAGAGGGGIAAAATAGLGLAAGGSAAHSPAAMAALRRGAARFWTAYSLQLAERPLLTKCATGIVGTILGDFIAQLSSHAMSTSASSSSASSSAPASHAGAKDAGAAGSASFAVGGGKDAYSGDKDTAAKKQPGFKYDFQRMLRLCLWSVAVGTPLGHYWFQFLDTRIMPHAPTSNAAVVTKLLLDQLLMSPAGTALFFFGFRLLEGGTMREARTSVYDKWGPTMALNYVLWPAANIVNFKYVPPEQRILYCNCVALLWSAVMSHMATRKPSSPATTTTTTTTPATAHAAVGGGKAYGMALAGGGRAGSGVVRERDREHHRGDREKDLAPAPAGAAAAH